MHKYAKQSKTTKYTNQKTNVSYLQLSLSTNENYA